MEKGKYIFLTDYYPLYMLLLIPGYFFYYHKREGYVPGNPSTQPITVAHFMVDGGSDDASLLQQQVTPDESLGDGLKVYKDSFNAY